jgi:hypothetical protein
VTSARRPTGSWIAQNYEKLALAVTLALLLLSSLFLVLRIGAGRNQAKVDEPPSGGIAAAPVDMATWEKTLELLEKPLQIPPAAQRLMVGELRVACVVCGRPIAYNAAVCPFDNVAQPAVGAKPDTDGDGIPDQDELMLGLNPNDASDGRADLDADLFRNDEEFRYGTDLKDPKSFPPPLAKMRVDRILTRPFKLRFQAISEFPDGVRYQLNLRSLEKTYFVKMGDTVEGYKVSSYEPKAERGPTLILEQAGKRIRLVQGQEIQQDQREAVLVFLLDLQRFEVTSGATVTIKDKSYKVVDINENRVLIRDEEAGTDTPIGLASEEDRLLMQGGSAAPAAGPVSTAQ